jgi:hypothetical protein
MSENTNTKTENTKTWKNEKLNLLVIADQDNYMEHSSEFRYIMIYHTDNEGNRLEKDDLYSAIATSSLESFELSEDQWNWLDNMAGEFEDYIMEALL